MVEGIDVKTGKVERRGNKKNRTAKREKKIE